MPRRDRGKLPGKMKGGVIRVREHFGANHTRLMPKSVHCSAVARIRGSQELNQTSSVSLDGSIYPVKQCHGGTLNIDTGCSRCAGMKVEIRSAILDYRV